MLHTVGPGIWRENWKMRKMRNSNCKSLHMVRNTEKHAKWKIHNVRPGIWKQTEKHWKLGTHMVGHEIWGDTLKNMWNLKHTL